MPKLRTRLKYTSNYFCRQATFVREYLYGSPTTIAGLIGQLLDVETRIADGWSSCLFPDTGDLFQPLDIGEVDAAVAQFNHVLALEIS